jgi:plasmid stabilization system protein ParE
LRSFSVGEAVSIQRSGFSGAHGSGSLVRAASARLGGKLFDSVTRAIEHIQVHQEIGVPRPDRLPSRQFRVRGFPYKVAYRIREHDIYVVAVAHTSRRPGYWKDRG